MSLSQCQTSLPKGFPFWSKVKHLGGFRDGRDIPGKEREPAEGAWAWRGGEQDEERGHSSSWSKRELWQPLTRREEQQHGGEGGFQTLQQLLSSAPVAPSLGAFGSFLIPFLRDASTANASPCRKPPCRTGKIHFTPKPLQPARPTLHFAIYLAAANPCCRHSQPLQRL